MTKPKTYFEQVPLEVVKELIGEKITEDNAVQPARRTKKKKSAKNLVGTGRSNGERS